MHSEDKPIAISDIQCTVLYQHKNGSKVYCIGSCIADRYLTINSENAIIYYSIIKKMDGGLTYLQLEEYASSLGYKHELTSFFNRFEKSGLLINNDIPEDTRYTELRRIYKEIACLKINKISTLCSRINTRILPILTTVIILLLLITCVHLKNILFSMPWSTISGDLRVIVYSLVVSTFSVLFHEFGHIIFGSIFGLKIKYLRIITFTYLTLACYVDLPGIYFLTRKKRILIWFAGSLFNLILVLLCLLLYKHTNNHLQLVLSVCIIFNVSMAFNSLIPFRISDGYFILATLLKVPNLRSSAFRNIVNSFENRTIKNLKFETPYHFYYFIALILATLLAITMLSLSLYKPIASFFTTKPAIDVVVFRYLNIIIIIGFFCSMNIVKLIRKIYKNRGNKNVYNFGNRKHL